MCVIIDAHNVQFPGLHTESTKSNALPHLDQMQATTTTTKNAHSAQLISVDGEQ